VCRTRRLDSAEHALRVVPPPPPPTSLQQPHLPTQPNRNPPPPPPTGTWVLVDFGLARRYTTDTAGSHAPERPEAQFRGSTTYASLHAHQGRDLSRRDDLWSWLFMVIEMWTGERPWWGCGRRVVGIKLCISRLSSCQGRTSQTSPLHSSSSSSSSTRRNPTKPPLHLPPENNTNTNTNDTPPTGKLPWRQEHDGVGANERDDRKAWVAERKAAAMEDPSLFAEGWGEDEGGGSLPGGWWVWVWVTGLGWVGLHRPVGTPSEALNRQPPTQLYHPTPPTLNTPSHLPPTPTPHRAAAHHARPPAQPVLQRCARLRTAHQLHV